jgi:hypothetical protein
VAKSLPSGTARYDDERRDATCIQLGSTSGDPEVIPAEHQQAPGRAHRDAQAQVMLHDQRSAPCLLIQSDRSKGQHLVGDHERDASASGRV